MAYQAQSRSRSPSPRFRQSQSNDRRDYAFRPRSRDTNSQNRLPSQQSQTFTGLTPAQRSQSSQTQNSQSRPFYNSGMERLRSQNSLFNSGESRAYRERERERDNSRDRNYDSRQNQREREDFHQGDQHIAVFPKKEKTVIATTKITVLTMIEIEVQVEKETSDS